MGLVLVTSRSFSNGRINVRSRLEQAGHSVIVGDPSHDLGKVGPILEKADAWIAGTAPIGIDHTKLASNLKIIARYGVGTESVSAESLQGGRIILTNTPGANSDSVADHAVGLMLAILRGTLDTGNLVRGGQWTPRMGRELSGLTVGIAGLGRIGRGVATRLSGFRPNLIGFDPFIDPKEAPDEVSLVSSLEDLISLSDVLTLHLPGGETIINRQRLSLFTRGSYLINTARGDLVDEEALAGALRSGKIEGFAADTLSTEHSPTDSPLLSTNIANRVIVTPHLGAQTLESVDRMSEEAAKAVIDVLDGRNPDNPVHLEKK